MSQNPITGKEELRETIPDGVGPDGRQTQINVSDLGGNTGEYNSLDIELTSNRAFLTTGADVTFSSDRGAAALKLVLNWSAVTGGYHSLYSLITTSGAIATAGAGVVGIKMVVKNTAKLTNGVIYGGQFIAKHAGATGINMANAAALIGLEAIAYISSAAHAGTAIGLNAVLRNFATDGQQGGSVHRGIQVVLDLTGATAAVETSGICVWNMGGAADNVLNVVNSATGFTNFVLFTDDGKPAQSTSTSVTNVGARGWIKVKVGAATRYIALGDGVT